MFTGNWPKQLWKVNIDFHEEYLRKRQHDWNFKRLHLHLDFQWFFSSPFSYYTTWEKYTHPISLAQELMKVKVRKYKWIPFTLMKLLTVIPIHIHITLFWDLPRETKYTALKKKVRLNFLTHLFLCISKTIMDKVQGQLCTRFKRKCGRMRQRWHQNKGLFIWNITVHQPTVWKLTGTNVEEWTEETAQVSHNTVML